MESFRRVSENRTSSRNTIFPAAQDKIVATIRVQKDHVVRLGDVDLHIEGDGYEQILFNEYNRKVFFPYDGTAYADYKLSNFQDKAGDHLYRYYLTGVRDGLSNEQMIAEDIRYILSM